MSSKEKYPLEIINAGFFRCGSASLAEALRQLGCGPIWHTQTNSREKNKKGLIWWTKHVILDKIENDDVTINFDEWLQEIQSKVIMDVPVVFIWDKIFAQYPKSKVIVVVRDDLDRWVISYQIILNSVAYLYGFPVKYIMKFVPFFSAEVLFHFKYWNKYHNGDVSKFCEANNEEIKKMLKDKLKKHIEKVKRIVPPNQLLIFKVSDGWNPLCEFLQKPIPDKPFPRINSAEVLKKMIKQHRRQESKAVLVVVSLCFVILVVVCGIVVQSVFSTN
eukprot:478372_1